MTPTIGQVLDALPQETRDAFIRAFAALTPEQRADFQRQFEEEFAKVQPLIDQASAELLVAPSRTMNDWRGAFRIVTRLKNALRKLVAPTRPYDDRDGPIGPREG